METERLAYACAGMATDDLSKAIHHAIEITRQTKKDTVVTKHSIEVAILRSSIINGGM